MDSYTAQDTIIFEDYRGEWILSGLADNTVVDLTAPNESSTISTGWNGNSLGAHNQPGRQRHCELRLVKGCSDDKRLNENLNLWEDMDPRFVPLKCSFTKTVAHGDGTRTKDTVRCWFGFPGQKPDQKSDTNGDTDQVVSPWMIKFGNSKRSM